MTYVGATVNLARRLRQHNGEIKGGAKYTRLGAKGSWSVVFTVEGFREQREALQFEWALKHKVSTSKSDAVKMGDTSHRKRKRRKRSVTRAHGKGVAGRVRNLARVLSLPQWTKQSPPSAHVPLLISWHDADHDRPPTFGEELPAYVTEVYITDAVSVDETTT